MSNVVTSVLGLVVPKVRSAAASYLSNGDLTNEELRQKIISDIDDIKSSLRGLSRQPLNSSFCFLKEGISRLGTAVRNTTSGKQNVQADITHAVEQFVAGAGASTSQQTKQCFAGEALSSSTFEILSQERWADAKESFKMSRVQATIAFGNTALSIEDLIMASKLRIVSSILEKFLDDPEAAARDCLLYLQELHDLPAVRQNFTVHVRGGFKSLFYKTKRSEIVDSVEAINNVLLEFMVEFTLEFTQKMVHYHHVKWPVIRLTDIKYPWKHVVVDTHTIKEVKEKREWEEMRKSWPKVKFRSGRISSYRYPEAVDSKGLIHWDQKLNFLLLFSKHERRNVVLSVDISLNDHIYTLYRVIDADYVKKVGSDLKLTVDDGTDKCRAITEGLPSLKPDTCWVMRVVDNKIVLCNCYGEVFVFTLGAQDRLNMECWLSLPSFDSSHGKPWHGTEPTDVFMCVTNKREVIITTQGGEKVYICSITDEGQIEPIIQVPLEEPEVDSRVLGLAFDPTHEEDIVVLKSIEDKDLSRGFYERIDIYSRNGKIQDFFRLPKRGSRYSVSRCLSNPKGIVVVVQYRFSCGNCYKFDLVGKGGSRFMYNMNKIHHRNQETKPISYLFHPGKYARR